MITEILSESEEESCDIRIIVRTDRWGFNNEFWGIQIDNTITPLFCCNCKTQLNGLYKLDGGRYGQVGSVLCSCGAIIHCTDSDNIVQYLDTATSIGQEVIANYRIDYSEIYKLDNSSFIRIKEKLGFDIYRKYANKTVDLKTIINELEVDYGLKTNIDVRFVLDKFQRLPIIVKKWFSILEQIDKGVRPL